MDRRDFMKNKLSPLANLDGFRLDPSGNDFEDKIDSEILPKNNISFRTKSHVLINIGSSHLLRKPSSNQYIDSDDSDSDYEYKNLMPEQVPKLASEVKYSFETQSKDEEEYSKKNVRVLSRINKGKLQLNSENRKYPSCNMNIFCKDDHSNLSCKQNNCKIKEINNSEVNSLFTTSNTINNCKENKYTVICKVEVHQEGDWTRLRSKKKSSLGMISDLNWSKKVGNFEILKNQQILYKLIQKHSANSKNSTFKNLR